ncbi:hypothetical protein OG455_01790 [Kitasatospora sp. NBC_01287]|uniref:hypothetical protein n=1 Tax=Kitasatospora sp. NBC_01287 TaxID=2903573 RepID=UPI00224F8D37|nr:hypothetical protein [Kitasatospora sp. NBC_01287]MCX4744256.1 hypothetical protein [Kitasatospora sp. NBC_01287]
MAVTGTVVPPLAQRPGPAPEETPECEGSTTAGISVPEPVELHDAWSGLVPMLLIGVMVIACVGFMIGRMLAL